MTTSTVLGIPFLSSQQATPEILHNEALYMIEAMLRGVKAIQNAPPGGPADGDTYIVGTAGTGAWLGKNNCVAIYMSNAWRFVPGFDTLGAQIAMGAAQEGLRVFNQATDLLLTWTGSAWSTASVSGAAVSNTPAGNIAATTAQGAINELDTEKAGLALANVLTAVQTIQFAAPAFYMLNLVNTDNGAVGPFLHFTHDSSSPAVNDFLAGLTSTGRNSAAALIDYGGWNVRALNVTAGVEASGHRFTTNVAGVAGTRLSIENGLIVGAAASGDQGAGTVNAVNYFDDGVNINLIYAGLAAVNAFTAGQSITVSNPATELLLLQQNDLGASGVSWGTIHNSNSPAVNDIISSLRHAAFNGSAALTNYAISQVVLTNVGAGTEGAKFNWRTRINNAFADRLQLGAGLFSANATTGDMGADTANFSNYYANANIIADTSGLLRTRTYTVATLPASGGVTGAFARVSDSLAAPVYNAAAVGGGTTFAQVTSDGTIWRYC